MSEHHTIGIRELFVVNCHTPAVDEVDLIHELFLADNRRSCYVNLAVEIGHYLSDKWGGALKEQVLVFEEILEQLDFIANYFENQLVFQFIGQLLVKLELIKYKRESVFECVLNIGYGFVVDDVVETHFRKGLVDYVQKLLHVHSYFALKLVKVFERLQWLDVAHHHWKHADPSELWESPLVHTYLQE